MQRIALDPVSPLHDVFKMIVLGVYAAKKAREAKKRSQLAKLEQATVGQHVEPVSPILEDSPDSPSTKSIASPSKSDLASPFKSDLASPSSAGVPRTPTSTSTSKSEMQITTVSSPITHSAFSSPTVNSAKPSDVDVPAELPLTVRARSTNLSSGFDYHPALFHLHIPPDKWAAFTDAVVQAAKLTVLDHTRAIAAGVGVGLSGIWGVGYRAGIKSREQQQAKRIRRSLHGHKSHNHHKSEQEKAEDGLANVLDEWNTEFFRGLGLQAMLEVSEVSDKEMRTGKTDWSYVKPWSWIDDKDSLERRKNERRCRIVISKLGEGGVFDDLESPTGIQEEIESPAGVPEMEGSVAHPDMKKDGQFMAEMEADVPLHADRKDNVFELAGDGTTLAELPAEPVTKLPMGAIELPEGAFELPADSIEPPAYDEKH